MTGFIFLRSTGKAERLSAPKGAEHDNRDYDDLDDPDRHPGCLI
jgi:hypothetical protein